MTDDELRATAEMVIESLELYHAGKASQDDGIVILQGADDLARAYLAEHPADDAEPVTADWLRGLGFWKRCDSELCSPRTGRWMLVHDSDPVAGFSSVWNLSFPGCQQSLAVPRGSERRGGRKPSERRDPWGCTTNAAEMLVDHYPGYWCEEYGEAVPEGAELGGSD